MFFKSRLTLFSALSASALVFGSANSSKAQDASYEFTLPDLLTGCFSLGLPHGKHSDCYDDQNVIRASGFSHFDGSLQPYLTSTFPLTPLGPIPSLLQAPPVENSLWQRLHRTQFSMHVIDKEKIDTTKFEIVNGANIYTDENFNLWRNDFDDKKWYVKMAHQFSTLKKDGNDEIALWCDKFSPTCEASGLYKHQVINIGVGGGPIFFAPILSENAPQAKKDKVNLGDWLRARPEEYDLTNPETVNARANFFVGGRGIGANDDPYKEKAFWNHVALVWVDPDQLFRPAQNTDIKIAEFAKVVNHLDNIQDNTVISWCIDQFKNVKSDLTANDDKNGKCTYAFRGRDSSPQTSSLLNP